MFSSTKHNKRLKLQRAGPRWAIQSTTAPSIVIKSQRKKEALCVYAYKAYGVEKKY